MGACSPITLPVTIELGGSMAVALNALAFVPATRGGGRFCARGHQFARRYFRTRRSLAIELLSICWTLFPCSRPWSTPCPGDHIFMSERRAGASICLWILSLWVLAGIPPIDILDNYHVPKTKITYNHIYLPFLHWECAQTCLSIH